MLIQTIVSSAVRRRGVANGSRVVPPWKDPVIARGLRLALARQRGSGRDRTFHMTH